MKFYIVDCFAESKYQGNQLAVLIPDRKITDAEMQQIAKEIGFSETAFILSDKQPNGGYDVRIFTPAIEVPFAGHPTLGTAYIIHHILEQDAGESVILNLQAGQIPVRLLGDELVMSQNQPQFGEILENRTVAGALSLCSEDIREDYPVQWVSTGLEAVIVPLKTIAAVEKCHVDYEERQRFIDEHYACNILVFAEAEDGLRVRVFMEDPGFLEDPATGSANGDLAAYLLKHDFFGSRSLQYAVSQGSEMGRPSRLFVQAAFDGENYQIEVGGHAYLVAEGDWK